MQSHKYSKSFYHLLLGIISVTTLPRASSIPTTLSPITTASVNKASSSQVNSFDNTDINSGKKTSKDILFVNQQNHGSYISENSPTDHKIRLDSHKTLKNEENELPLNNINNGSINFTPISSNNSPEEQLTQLSADEKNRSQINSMIRSNEIRPDLGDGTDGTLFPFLSSTDSMRQSSNNNDNDKYNNENGIKQTSIVSSIPEFIPNKERTQLPASSQNPKEALNHYESNRYKRSHYRNINSLHSNLDDLLNIRRQRRELRYKRNTNYDDLLATLLAAEEAKYNDNYNSYPTNEVNLEANPKSLYSYVDLDKLGQYYNENILPLLEIDNESDLESTEDSQEFPVVIQPYTQQVIPVLPYPFPDRYQRIRRSYYRKYQNPLSLYSGLRKKRNRYNNYDTNQEEWGRIVDARDERSTYEDDAEEANKIYSLATLMAIGKTPDQFSLRYKRSVKPIMNVM